MSLIYCWFGPHCVEDTSSTGQDTIGPDLSNRVLTEQDIEFWCMEEEYDYYQNYFQDSRVNVYPVEPFLRENEPELERFIQQLKLSAAEYENTAIEEKAAGNISTANLAQSNANRERTTCKELIQYFLQTKKAGLFADTNVTPDPLSDAKKLATFEKLAPVLVKYSKTDIKVDVFMMFSPEGDKTAQSRYQYMYDNAKSEFDNRQNRKINRKKLEPIVTSALINSVKTDKTLKPVRVRIKEISESKSLNSVVMNIESGRDTGTAMGLKKRFNNSHKANSALLPSYITRALFDPNGEREFLYMLEKGACKTTQTYKKTIRCFDDTTQVTKTLIQESVSIKNKLILQKLLQKFLNENQLTEISLIDSLSKVLKSDDENTPSDLNELSGAIIQTPHCANKVSLYLRCMAIDERPDPELFHEVSNNKDLPLIVDTILNRIEQIDIETGSDHLLCLSKLLSSTDKRLPKEQLVSKIRDNDDAWNLIGHFYGLQNEYSKNTRIYSSTAINVINTGNSFLIKTMIQLFDSRFYSSFAKYINILNQFDNQIATANRSLFSNTALTMLQVNYNGEDLDQESVLALILKSQNAIDALSFSLHEPLLNETQLSFCLYELRGKFNNKVEQVFGRPSNTIASGITSIFSTRRPPFREAQVQEAVVQDSTPVETIQFC